MGELGVVVVAGLLSLGGVLVGQRLQRSDGHLAWLRERRLQAYGELLSALRHIRAVCGDVYYAYDDDERAVVAANVSDVAREVGRALGMVEVLGPQDVSDSARIAVESHQDLLEWVMDPASGLPAKVSDRQDLLDTDQGSAMLDAEKTFRIAARSVVT